MSAFVAKCSGLIRLKLFIRVQKKKINVKTLFCVNGCKKENR